MKIKRKLSELFDLILIRNSIFFDEEFYLKNNPDVEKSSIQPQIHYLRFGGLEKRNPGPFFNSSWYLKEYPDVAASRMNPLVHYLKYGANEMRKPNPNNIVPFVSTHRAKIYLDKTTEKIKRMLFNLTQKINHYKVESQNFQKYQGYSLNLKAPESFNEKLVWKKLHDRNPLLPIVADKFLVRDYVKDKLGDEFSQQFLIPLICHCEKPEEIPFKSLPEQYIIKTNHASNQNIIVRDRNKVERERIIQKCQKWLAQPYGFYMNEWAYQKIKPSIIIEKLMLDETGKVPDDYKFFVFHGKCKLIQMDFDRFKGHKRSMFDENWNYLDLVFKYKKGPDAPRPKNFQKMKQIAEILGQDFDFVRVDLYEIEDRVYFGELTHYPEAATGNFIPRDYDFKIGSYWHLKPGYWKK